MPVTDFFTWAFGKLIYDFSNLTFRRKTFILFKFKDMYLNVLPNFFIYFR